MPVRPLEPLLAEKARVELGEDVNRIEEHIRTVKLWIAEQPHLIARTDDQWLVAFLRGCKYNINKVKKKMELFYNIRSTSPDVYCVKYNEPKIYSLLEMGICLIMPKTKIESADPRVVVYRIGQFQTSKYHMLEFLAVLLLQFQHVPKESLPVEYGDYWKIKMREYHSWFEEDTKYVVDESKRVKNASLKSCFKQINEID
ncbi:unnamed protein product [Leptidea sinapis]|uniref:CRAL/TRIO N-terminal domain-containing protein n=1 Tax=Leptidea sinapis TaxID=189913 RepID=A0A5E4Q0W9_9NEOP|nr:unnamed protein product [Leptidea sinapis]